MEYLTNKYMQTMYTNTCICRLIPAYIYVYQPSIFMENLLSKKVIYKNTRLVYIYICRY